jgi:hypothetical protein
MNLRLYTLVVHLVGSVISMQVSDATVPLVVRASQPAILIERERGVGSGIDTHFSDLRYLARALDRRRGDACRLLSKEEVGRAIGVEIVPTQPADSGGGGNFQGI